MPRRRGSFEIVPGADALWQAMVKRKLTQAALASKLDAEQPSISVWLSGRARPKQKFRARMFRLLDIDPSLWLTRAEYLAAFGKARPKLAKAG